MADLTVAKLREALFIMGEPGPYLEIEVPWLTHEEAADLQAYLDTLGEDANG
jgi:hypothetical protein